MKTSNHRITLKDFYLQYPYKWRDINSNTISIPYFNKKEITNTKYTLDYKTWKTVILEYFKLILEYLETGMEFHMGHSLGYLQIKKKKGGGINHKKTKEFYGDLAYRDGRIIKYKNMHTGGYKPVVKWYRTKAKLKYKWLWRFNFLQNKWKDYSRKIDKTPKIINNLNNL